MGFRSAHGLSQYFPGRVGVQQYPSAVKILVVNRRFVVTQLSYEIIAPAESGQPSNKSD